MLILTFKIQVHIESILKVKLATRKPRRPWKSGVLTFKRHFRSDQLVTPCKPSWSWWVNLKISKMYLFTYSYSVNDTNIWKSLHGIHLFPSHFNFYKMIFHTHHLSNLFQTSDQSSLEKCIPQTETWHQLLFFLNKNQVHLNRTEVHTTLYLKLSFGTCHFEPRFSAKTSWTSKWGSCCSAGACWQSEGAVLLRGT